MTDALGDLGRFAEPSLLILVSLSDRPKHGYAFMEDMVAIGGVRVGPGTLYGALARLETRVLIEALPPEERRRPYRLTGSRRDHAQGAAGTVGRIRADRPPAPRRQRMIRCGRSSSLRVRHGGSDSGSFADHCPFAIDPMHAPTGIVGGTALYCVPDAALCTDLALKR